MNIDSVSKKLDKSNWQKMKVNYLMETYFRHQVIEGIKFYKKKRKRRSGKERKRKKGKKRN